MWLLVQVKLYAQSGVAFAPAAPEHVGVLLHIIGGFAPVRFNFDFVLSLAGCHYIAHTVDLS